MTTAAASLQMATYPGGKQSYYPFPMPSAAAALSSTYMYGGGCGGGTMTLTHPPTINTFCSDSVLGLHYSEMNGGHSTEELISPVSPSTRNLQIDSYKASHLQNNT